MTEDLWGPLKKMLQADADTHRPIFEAQKALDPHRVWSKLPQTVVGSWGELVHKANLYSQEGIRFCSLDCVVRRNMGFWVPTTEEWFVLLLTSAREDRLTLEAKRQLGMEPEADLNTITGRWLFFGDPMEMAQELPIGLSENVMFRDSVELMLELHAANLKDEDLEDAHYDEMGDLWYQLSNHATAVLRKLAAYLNWTGGLLRGTPFQESFKATPQEVSELNTLIEEKDFGPRFLQLLRACSPSEEGLDFKTSV